MEIPGTTTGGYDSRRHYLSIVKGRLAQRVKETDEKAEKRITEEGKIIYERNYKTITGMLKDVWINDGKFGTELLIKMMPDEENEVIIQLAFDGKYAQEFLLKLPNIDRTQQVTIAPYNFDDKEKKKEDGTPVKVIGITITHANKKVQKYYTPETPNGCPMPQIGADGKLVYLDKEDFKILNIQQKKFLKQALEEWRNGTTPAAVSMPEATPEPTVTKAQKKKPTKVESDDFKDSDIDQLPF